MLHADWDLYDTRHTVYRPARMTHVALEEGYRRAYRDFYRWGSIMRGAWTKPNLMGAVRHAAYAGGWKKFEPLWDWVIRARRISKMLPVLEGVLTGFGKHPSQSATSGASSGKPALNAPFVSSEPQLVKIQR
jgi:hypothetical protein